MSKTSRGSGVFTCRTSLRGRVNTPSLRVGLLGLPECTSHWGRAEEPSYLQTKETTGVLDLIINTKRFFLQSTTKAAAQPSISLDIWHSCVEDITVFLLSRIAAPAGQNECGGQGVGSPTMASSQ